MGALNNAIPFSLIVWAQVAIDSGLAAILNATTPLFTVLLAHVLTRDERLTRGRIAGVLFGIAGVAVLVGPEVLGELGAEGLAIWAAILMSKRSSKPGPDPDFQRSIFARRGELLQAGLLRQS